MIERILGRLSFLLIVLAVLFPFTGWEGRDWVLTGFFISALLLCVYYIKETSFSVYTFVMFLYALGFLGKILDLHTNINMPGVTLLSIPASILFGILILWTSRILYKKIGGDALYVSITGIVLLAHIIILFTGNDRLIALGTNLYYILLGLIATIKIKREIDEALIPAEQKILNILLLVIAQPISNLIISTVKSF